jgi:DNA polymerase III subunit beta
MEHSFTVNQKLLAAMLASMQPICAKRTTLDSTTSILFEAALRELVLKSTDLEISLQYNCAVDQSDIGERQSFLVSGKRVFDVIKELDGDIEFKLKGNQVFLNAGSVRLSLNIKDSQEFPPFPERIENLMQFDASFLLSILNHVAFLIPQNNANPSLNGLFIEIDSSGLRATATDGHCLAQVNTPLYTLENAQSWLLPRRGVFELKKILESTQDKIIFLGTCGNQLVFSGESFNFFTKVLAESFPEYRPVMDRAGFNKGTINRAHFLKTLRRATCLLSGQFIPTQFRLEHQTLSVSMLNKEVGNLEETLALEAFDGNPLIINFYAPYALIQKSLV